MPLKAVRPLGWDQDWGNERGAEFVTPITIQQHILQEQQKFPGATGEFSFLLSGITLATKMIQAKVRRAGLTDIIGHADSTNVQGEVQQKLDVYANEVLIQSLSSRPSVGILASEENEQPIVMPHQSPLAKYAVVFDPLDGSSNIDVNVSVGTTFSIFRRPEGLHRRKWRSWIHVGPGRGRVYPEPREHQDAGKGELLFGQRSLSRQFPRTVSGFHQAPEEWRIGTRVQFTIHRFVGCGFSSHAVARRLVHVPTDQNA